MVPDYPKAKLVMGGSHWYCDILAANQRWEFNIYSVDTYIYSRLDRVPQVHTPHCLDANNVQGTPLLLPFANWGHKVCHRACFLAKYVVK